MKYLSDEDFPSFNLYDLLKSQSGFKKKGINEIRVMVANRYGDYEDEATREELIELLK